MLLFYTIVGGVNCKNSTTDIKPMIFTQSLKWWVDNFYLWGMCLRQLHVGYDPMETPIK